MILKEIKRGWWGTKFDFDGKYTSLIFVILGQKNEFLVLENRGQIWSVRELSEYGKTPSNHPLNHLLKAIHLMNYFAIT